MLLLLFKVGGRHFAMPTNMIREIVPLVCLSLLPDVPDYVAGLMRYRGTPIPVIDLCLLSAGRACTPRLSTRIIIVEYNPTDGRPALLGLIAEHVVETIRSKLHAAPVSEINLDDLIDQPATRVTPEEKIRWFDPEQMLPTREIGNLFALQPEIREDGQRFPACK
jgi:chemotaxis-related protein WspB